MNELQQRIFSQESRDVPVASADRRREPRTQMARPVYVRPSDPNGERFEEVRTMTDFSRSGLYFITERESYFDGMQLYVTPAFGCMNLEYVGEVVRIERLPFGEFGIAVRLLRVGNSVVTATSTTKSAFQSFALVDHVPQAPFRQDSDNSSR
jgi:PilZ domain